MVRKCQPDVDDLALSPGDWVLTTRGNWDTFDYLARLEVLVKTEPVLVTHSGRRFDPQTRTSLLENSMEYGELYLYGVTGERRRRFKEWLAAQGAKETLLQINWGELIAGMTPRALCNLYQIATQKQVTWEGKASTTAYFDFSSKQAPPLLPAGTTHIELREEIYFAVSPNWEEPLSKTLVENYIKMGILKINPVHELDRIAIT